MEILKTIHYYYQLLVSILHSINNNSININSIKPKQNENKQTKNKARFKAEQSDTVCHKDARLMPADRSVWRSVNFITPKRGAPMVTIWINRAISSFATCPFDVFQTWNPLVAPRPSLVLTRASLWRPIVSLDSDAALHSLAALQGIDQLWHCGSWTRPGVPLLEQVSILFSLPPSYPHTFFALQNAIGCS
jgi:hypothetical protein